MSDGKIISSIATHQLDSLEDVLGELAKYGKPQLLLLDSGWHCSIQMHINAIGASLKIKSDFDMHTHIAAAAQCLMRVRQHIKPGSVLSDVDPSYGTAHHWT
jgi:hypothetical protein